MEPDQDDLRQFVVQPRVVLPLRGIGYNVPHAIGLYLDGFSGAEKMKDKQWCKAQIVVMLSHTRRAKDTIIVENKEYALSH
mmetsp:Transcript_23917/g.39133  ORF Transcript_23917/g.39133 Transcript_23917/m.39133 type:complete len:81 (-) Transcript_23917:101-343(-)